ncbi:MAG TPA: ABC transporter permease [Candidatus Limiplasma sp.]|nr:ABC transporter permease [Candidatus Limiplasma sp.]
MSNAQNGSAEAYRGDARQAFRRLCRLMAGELRFLAKYGILPLYLLLTVLYLALLAAVPAQARADTAAIVILTDPAAMGLFFMGAMVMLEKSQRVHQALAVSPVRVWEYIAAKAAALMAVGLGVGLAIAAFTGLPLLGVALAMLLGSVLFSLLGMVVAVRSVSLNQFLILSVPFELLTFTPALLYWFRALSGPLWLAHPGVAAMALFAPDASLWPWAVLSLAAWDGLAMLWASRAVKRYFCGFGGDTL